MQKFSKYAITSNYNILGFKRTALPGNYKKSLFSRKSKKIYKFYYICCSIRKNKISNLTNNNVAFSEITGGIYNLSNINFANVAMYFDGKSKEDFE